jgi:catalase
MENGTVLGLHFKHTAQRERRWLCGVSRTVAYSGLSGLTWNTGLHKVSLALDGGKSPGLNLSADHTYEDQRSTMFNAMLTPGGDISSNDVRHIRQAFDYFTAIGATAKGWTTFLSGCRLGAFFWPGAPVVREALCLPVARLCPMGMSYGVISTGKYGVAGVVVEILKSWLGGKASRQILRMKSASIVYERETDGLASMMAF